jgi:hypothetical protein
MIERRPPTPEMKIKDCPNSMKTRDCRSNMKTKDYYRKRTKDYLNNMGQIARDCPNNTLQMAKDLRHITIRLIIKQIPTLSKQRLQIRLLFLLPFTGNIGLVCGHVLVNPSMPFS